jgi:hypothetical protein
MHVSAEEREVLVNPAGREKPGEAHFDAAMLYKSGFLGASFEERKG